jgi:hypothetical protein
MNYLTNYYKNLSEQLQERVNHLQKLLNEESKKGISLKLIDRLTGGARSGSGEGAKYIAVGEDNKPYTFYSEAQWAYNEEDPGHMGPKTTHVHSGNPEHGIEALREIKPDSGDKEHARLFDYYKDSFDYSPAKETE